MSTKLNNYFPRLTRQLARSLDEVDVDRWHIPMLLDIERFPTHSIEEDVVAINAIKLILSLKDERNKCTAKEANWALDDWLCTDDIESLSIPQRCVVGCALLESYAELPNHNRVSPPIRCGIDNIWPAIHILTPHGLLAIHYTLEYLIEKTEDIDLDEYEIAAIRLFSVIIDECLGRKTNVNSSQMVKSLRLIHEDEEENEEDDDAWGFGFDDEQIDYGKQQRAATTTAVEAILQCSKLSETTKTIFR